MHFSPALRARHSPTHSAGFSNGSHGVSPTGRCSAPQRRRAPRIARDKAARSRPKDWSSIVTNDSGITAPAPHDIEHDPVFDQEQAHLDETYAALEELERVLLAKIAKTHAAVAADKEAMADEFGVNLETDDDASETYADIAAANRIIDMYNMSENINFQRLNDARLLLRQPYFAKVVLQFKEGQPPKELYIGAAGASDESYKRLVVDWRSPVAEVYYNQDLGPTTYRANGRDIHVDMQLRRQFDIDHATLNAYFDTDVAIQDSLLLASLSRQRDGRMQAITATIQKEQNTVVRHEDVPVLLVSGIAGSGKTSVLLQRIAYLFYQRRGELDPSQVFLITPNPVFRRYIDNVLPDMGEKNPECITWDEFAATLMPKGRAGGELNVPIEELLRIDDLVRNVEFEQHDFKDIESCGVRLIPAAQIAQLAAKYRRIPAGPRLVALMREELEIRLEARLKQMAATDAAQMEVEELSIPEQVEIFHETIAPQTDAEVRAYTLTYLRQKHADAYDTVARDEWLRVDRIGMRLTGQKSIETVTWLYLKMALTGMGNADAKYVMIDEVQDYTCAQLAVLARFFRRAHFLLLGDENQAIKPNTASFAEVRAAFEAMRGEVEECRLMTSYRSAPGITALFTRLMPPDDRVRVQSIQRAEEEPELIECPDEQRLLAELRNAIERAREDEGLTAIIVPWKQEARKLIAALGDDAPLLVDGRHSMPDAGVFVITLPLAKGLEFDHVIIPDASAKTFGENDLARRRLYTTISRATQKITILAQGSITPLLKG